MAGKSDADAPRPAPADRHEDLWQALLLDGDTPTPVRRDPSRPQIEVDADPDATRPARPSMASIPERQSCSGILPRPVPPPRASSSGISRVAALSAPAAPIVPIAPIAPAIRSTAAVPGADARGWDESDPAVAPAKSRAIRWIAIGAIAGVAAGVGITASGAVDLGGPGAASPPTGTPAPPAASSIEPPAGAPPATAAPSSTAAAKKEYDQSTRYLTEPAPTPRALPAPAPAPAPRDAARPPAASKEAPAAEKAPAASTTEEAPDATGSGSILDKEL